MMSPRTGTTDPCKGSSGPVKRSVGLGVLASPQIGRPRLDDKILVSKAIDLPDVSATASGTDDLITNTLGISPRRGGQGIVWSCGWDNGGGRATVRNEVLVRNWRIGEIRREDIATVKRCLHRSVMTTVRVEGQGAEDSLLV